MDLQLLKYRWWFFPAPITVNPLMRLALMPLPLSVCHERFGDIPGSYGRPGPGHGGRSRAYAEAEVLLGPRKMAEAARPLGLSLDIGRFRVWPKPKAEADPYEFVTPHDGKKIPQGLACCSPLVRLADVLYEKKSGAFALDLRDGDKVMTRTAAAYTKLVQVRSALTGFPPA